jgi:hypothetical protein
LQLHIDGTAGITGSTAEHPDMLCWVV